MSGTLNLRRVTGGTKPGELPAPPYGDSDISVLQAAYDALTTGTDPDSRGGGVLFVDRLYYCSKPLRMNRLNIGLRGLGGSGAARKVLNSPDNYAYFCGLVVPSWTRITKSIARSGGFGTLEFTTPHGLANGDVIVVDGYGRGNADIGYLNGNGGLVADAGAPLNSPLRRVFDTLFARPITVFANEVGGDNKKITFETTGATFTAIEVAVRADKPAIIVEENGATIEDIAFISDRIAALTTKTQLLDYQANFAGVGILGRTATTDITLKDVSFIGLRRGLDLNNSPGVRIWSFYGDCENGIRLTNCADSCEGRGIRLFSYVTQTDIVPTVTRGITAVEAATGRIRLVLDGAYGLIEGERAAVMGVNFLPAGTTMYRFTIKPDGTDALVLTDAGYATSPAPNAFTPNVLFNAQNESLGQLVAGKRDSCALLAATGVTAPFFDSAVPFGTSTKLGVRLVGASPLDGVLTSHLVNVQVQGSTTLGGFARIPLTGTAPAPIANEFIVDLEWNAAYATCNEPRVVQTKPGGVASLIAGFAGGTGTDEGFFLAAGDKLGLRLRTPLNAPAENEEVRLEIPGDPSLGGTFTIGPGPTTTQIVLNRSFSVLYKVLGYVRPAEVNLVPSERDGIGIQTSDVDGGYWNAAVKGHKTLYDLDSATMTWLSRRGESGAPAEKGINIRNSVCVRTGAQSDRFNSFGGNNKSSAIAVSINGTRTRPRLFGEQITDDGVAAVDITDGAVELWGCTKRGAQTRIRLGGETEWSGIYGGELTKEDLVLADPDDDAPLQRVNMLGYIPAGAGATAGMESVGASRHFVRGAGEWLRAFEIAQSTGRVAMNQGFVGLPLRGTTTAATQTIRLSADGTTAFTTQTVGPATTQSSRIIVYELLVVGYPVPSGGGFAAGDFYLFNPGQIVLTRRGQPNDPPTFEVVRFNPTQPIPFVSSGGVEWSGVALALTGDGGALPNPTFGTLRIDVSSPSTAATINWFADLRVRTRSG